MEAGTRLRAYEIRDQLGAGGFGEVYRAFQPVIGREVAIKIILPEFANKADFVRRFEGEAQLVARLEHPHIVPLYDYWRDPEGAYLVMRYIRGGSLTRSLKREGAWPLERAADLLDQIASALALAHRVGVVHRDIKPDNILLDEDGNAYLTDFGIAKSIQTEANDDEMTSGTLAYIAPEQLSGLPAQAASDQYALALVIAELIVGKHVYADVSLSELISKHLYEPLPDLRAMRVALPDTVNDVLFKATAKSPEGRFTDVLGFADAFRRAALGKDATQEFAAINLDLDRVVNPYKGLRPFQQADTGDFYGREALTNRLLSRMEENLPGRNFLAVVGASGSGKSSAVKAGLIPTIRGGAIGGSENWFIAEMTPGMNPLRELESTLLAISQQPVSGLGGMLRSGRDGLLKAVQAVAPNSDIFLVIDQFEEAFTLAPEADCSKLLTLIAEACEPKESRVHVLVTLRADFLDRPLGMPMFGDLLRRRIEFVLPLTPSELERAITGPIERIGLEVDPALIERINADVSEEPGALPLVQYALTEVFDRRSGRMLSLSAYEKIGGVTGALARRADEVYQGLTDDGKAAARQIMLRLLTLGEGKEDTRRRAPLSELVAVVPDNTIRQTALDAFTRARLLTFDQDQATREPVVEVAHEALIREWHLLRSWLDDSRADVRQQRQLAAAATEWSESRRDDSYLLAGTRLSQFEEWATITDLMLTPLERDYLSISTAERQRREEAEAARRAREEALEDRWRKILGVLAVVFAVATLLSVGLFMVALRNGQVAEENATRARLEAERAEQNALRAQQSAMRAEQNFERAEALRLASAANVLLYGQEANAEIGAMLAIRSLVSRYSNEADAALVQARSLMYVDRIFDIGLPVRSVAVTQGQTHLAAGGEDGSVNVYEVITGEKLWGYQSRFPIIDLAFSPDGTTLAASREDGGVMIFNENGTLRAALPVSASPIHTLTFINGSDALLTATADGLLTTWDAQTGRRILSVQAALQDTAYDLEVLPNGVQAVVAGYFQAPVIDLSTGEVLRVYDSLNNGITGVAATEDLLLTASQTGIAKVWDADSGEELLTLTNHTSSVNDGAFWPDGSGLVTISADGTARIWDLTTGAETRSLTGHTGEIRDLVLLPDTRQILTASSDGTVRLWNADLSRSHDRLAAHDSGSEAVWVNEHELITIGYPDTIVKRWDTQAEIALQSYEGIGVHHAIDVSPDRGWLAVGTRIYDITTGQLLREFPSDYWINDVAFSPNGRLLAVGGMRSGFDQDRIYTGVAEVWDIETGQRVLSLNQHTDEVQSVSFSPDSTLLLTASIDTTAILWNIAEGTLLQTFPHDNEVAYAEYSQDGAVILTSGPRIAPTLWNAQTGLKLRTFGAENIAVRGATLSPDGEIIATADLDGSLRLWDAETGRLERRVVGFKATLSLPIFSPDGRLIAVTAENGAVFLVRTQVNDLIAETCTLLPRDLSLPDRDRYRVTDLAATCPQFQVEGEEALALPPTATVAPITVPAPAMILPTPTPQGIADRPLLLTGDNHGELRAGQVESWLYFGRRGEVLTVRASADIRAYDVEDYFAGLDTLLVVFDPEGQVIAQNDDAADGSGDAELTFTLEKAGIYRIEVRSAGLSTAGKYRLIASLTKND